MVAREWLEILRCPESQQGLTLADAARIACLNQQISAGELLNRSGCRVVEKLDGGLLRADGRRVYPIRQGLPVLLVEESIPL